MRRLLPIFAILFMLIFVVSFAFADMGTTHYLITDPTLTPIPSITPLPSPTPAGGAFYFESAFDAYEMGDYQKAVDDYTLSLEYGDYYPTYAYHNRGLAYYQLGEYENALNDYTTALAQDPNYVSAYQNRALVYDALGDIASADADRRKVVELTPATDAPGLNTRGRSYENLGELQLALDDYTEAIRLDPTYVDTYLNRALLLKDKMERAEESYSDFLQWILLNEFESLTGDALQPDVPARFELVQGRVYRIPVNLNIGANISITTIGDPEPRVDPLIVLLDPDGIPVAADDDDAGDLDSLIRDFSAEQNGPYTLVLSHAGGGSYGTVTVTLTGATAVGNPIDLFNQGETYRAAGDYQAAIEAYSAAIRADSRYADAYYWRGRSYRSLGDYDAAIVDFTTVIGISPAYANAYISRGLTLEMQGQREAAAPDMYQWATLIEVTPTDLPALASGQSVAVDMTEGTVYRIPFSGNNGDTVSIRAYSTQVDTLIILLDPTGTPIISDDDGVPDGSLIDGFALPMQGAYTLIVTHAGGGKVGRISVSLNIAPRQLTADELFQLGYDASEAGHFAESLDYYMQAAELNPTDPYIFNNICYVSIRLETYRDALPNCDKAIELDSNYALAYLNRGIVRFNLGNKATAAQDYLAWIGLNQLTEPSRGILLNGSPLTREISAGQVHELTFSAQLGDKVTITVTDSTGFVDPLIVLINPNDVVMTGDDDSGGGLNAKIENLLITTGGQYTLIVSEAAAGGSGSVEILLTVER